MEDNVESELSPLPRGCMRFPCAKRTSRVARARRAVFGSAAIDFSARAVPLETRHVGLRVPRTLRRTDIVLEWLS